MPEVIDLVDYSAQKEIEKLETAFKELADHRAKGLISKEQERVAAVYSERQRQAVGAN